MVPRYKAVAIFEESTLIQLVMEIGTDARLSFKILIPLKEGSRRFYVEGSKKMQLLASLEVAGVAKSRQNFYR